MRKYYDKTIFTSIFRRSICSRTKQIFWWFPFFILYFPVLALPDLVNSKTDLSLEDLRSRLVQVSKAYLLKEGETAPLELGGVNMERHCIPEDRVGLYKPHTTVCEQGLILRSPEPGYLHRQSLYLGHRLLFGNGYLVTSLLVQF